VYAGRQGSMLQGTGSVAKLGMLSAFGTSYTGWSANASSSFIGGGIRDNTLTYVSPKFAGFQGYAQYSMGSNGAENKSVENEKYAAIAVTYSNGPLNLLLGVDRTFKAHEEDQHPDHPKDSTTITFGGNYDFGVAKVFGGVQYFKDVAMSKAYTVDDDMADFIEAIDKDFDLEMKGFGANLSASAPLGGGTALVGVSYMKGKQTKKVLDAFGYDFTRVRGSIGYSYPLSKRTNVYAAALVGQDEFKLKDLGITCKVKDEYAGAMVGLRHNF